MGTVGGGYQNTWPLSAAKNVWLKESLSFAALSSIPHDIEDIDAACGGELTVSCQYLDPALPNVSLPCWRR